MNREWQHIDWSKSDIQIAQEQGMLKPNPPMIKLSADQISLIQLALHASAQEDTNMLKLHWVNHAGKARLKRNMEEKLKLLDLWKTAAVVTVETHETGTPS